MKYSQKKKKREKELGLNFFSTGPPLSFPRAFACAAPIPLKALPLTLLKLTPLHPLDLSLIVTSSERPFLAILSKIRSDHSVMSDSLRPHESQHARPPSDQVSRSVVSDSWRPHESQHARPPCPSPTPGVHSDSRPSSQ